MEILIGAAVSLLSQLFKRASNKIGGSLTLILVFVFCFIGTAFYQTIAQAHGEFVRQLATMFFSAVGFYEVLLKRIPVIGKDE